jgi:predicted nucleic acid-binding protein
MPDTGVVVVADSGPLIALARIEQLELLPSLYERVTIPDAVWQVTAIRPSLERLRDSGIYVSPRLVALALQAVGEHDE